MGDPSLNTGAVCFWVGRILLLSVSAFFLAVGISILKAAYRLESPFEFIAVFFASNLMILISATLGLGFVISMYRRVRPGPGSESPVKGEGKEAGDESSSHRSGD